MSTKGSEPNSLSRAIADLESVEKRLAELTGADADEHAAAQLLEGRTLVRAAVRSLALALPNPLELSAPPRADDTSGRRGKTKGKVAAKSAPQEHRAFPNASADAAKDAPSRSLLARLDAAMPEPTQPSSAAANSAMPAPSATKTITAEITAEDAVARLARLEAEIAGLTELPLGGSSPDDLPAIAAIPTAREPAKPRPSPTSPARPKAPVVSETTTDSEDAEDDDAEIEIVSAGGRKSAGGAQQARSASRIAPDTPPGREDEAQVDIVRRDTAVADTEPRAPDKLSARLPMPAGNSGQGTKWRLFRD